MARKQFDCVEMKNQIQAQMQKEYEGLTDEEVRRRIRHRLETSDSIVAQKWRRMRDFKSAGHSSAERAK